MRRKLFLFSAVSYLILVLVDALVTFIATPDLELEANFLVKSFGFGWEALLIANALAYIFYVLIIYLALVKYKSPVYKVESFKQYCSMLYYNRPDKFAWSMYKMPKNWKPIFACIGYSIAIASLVWRLILVTEWLLFFENIDIELINVINNAVPAYGFRGLMLILVAIICTFYWIFGEYNLNKKNAVQVFKKSAV